MYGTLEGVQWATQLAVQGLLYQPFKSDREGRNKGGVFTLVRNNIKAGVYIQYPSGEKQAKSIPTGLHCTNYRAEEEAMIHAANTISSKVNQDSQVVLLTDALSVLQAVTNNKLPRLEQALDFVSPVVDFISLWCGRQ